jgi:hypothetical protein
VSLRARKLKGINSGIVNIGYGLLWLREEYLGSDNNYII